MANLKSMNLKGKVKSVYLKSRKITLTTAHNTFHQTDFYNEDGILIESKHRYPVFGDFIESILRCNNEGKIIEIIDKEGSKVWNRETFDHPDTSFMAESRENDVAEIGSIENSRSINNSKSNDGNGNYFEYEYDDQNNWIKKHEFLKSRRLVNISEREIEYYD